MNVEINLSGSFLLLNLPVILEWWCQNACQLLSDNINWQHESYKHIMYLYTSGWHSTSFNGVFIAINLLRIWIKCFFGNSFIFFSMKTCNNWEKLKLTMNRFEYMINNIYVQNSLATRNCITRNSLAAQITFCRKNNTLSL